MEKVGVFRGSLIIIIIAVKIFYLRGFQLEIMEQVLPHRTTLKAK
jgi:hypothetical protein